MALTEANPAGEASVTASAETPTATPSKASNGPGIRSTRTASVARSARTAA